MGVNMYTALPMPERFWSKVDIQGQDDCWPWLATKNQKGYGMFPYQGEFVAHRVAYRLVAGTIPVGLQLDHLCRERACVNPGHLEPVTAQDNILRGNGIAAREAKQTHCKHGHEFTPENTGRGHRRGGGRERRCLACHRLESRKRTARKRTERNDAREAVEREFPNIGVEEIEP